MPSRLDYGGSHEHGSITVGVTAVIAQATDSQIREWTGYNAGPGIIYPGTSSVTSTNTIPVAVGDYFVSDKSSTDLYLVADQAATVVRWFRERMP